MQNLGTTTIIRLRTRAAQCRKLARQAQSYGIAEELEKLASEYDKDASRLEDWGSFGVSNQSTGLMAAES